MDDALVAAAPEEEVGIALVLHERTVYQHVYQLQEFQLSRILYQVLKVKHQMVLLLCWRMARASSAKPSA